MNEDTGRTEQVDGDEELGEPIGELMALEEDVSKGFMSRVLSSLRRRSLVGHMATLVWTASAQAFIEFLGMIFSMFSPGESPKKEDRTNG
jgi:hypothetical protein